MKGTVWVELDRTMEWVQNTTNYYFNIIQQDLWVKCIVHTAPWGVTAHTTVLHILLKWLTHARPMSAFFPNRKVASSIPAPPSWVSRCPWARHLTLTAPDELDVALHGWRPCRCGNGCMGRNGWMLGYIIHRFGWPLITINELYKCSPFTIS